MTRKFCTVDDVKSQLNIAGNWAGDDVLLSSHISTATALIRSYTRRIWTLGNYTQFFSTPDINIAIGRGDNVARFTLKEKPVNSITEVIFHSGGDWTNADPLQNQYYELDTSANAFFIYPGILTSGTRNMRVRYTAGYEVDDTDTDLLLVNDNLRYACAIQAAFTFKRVVNETSGSKQKQDKKGLTTYSLTASGLVGEALALIKGETRILLGGNG